MPKTQDRLSLEPFLAPVQELISLAGSPPLTSTTVQFQFVNGGLPPRARPTTDPEPPATTGWVDGFWETTETGLVFAGILVGPEGTVTLPPGRYAVWIRILSSPSQPVAPIDQLTIK